MIYHCLVNFNLINNVNTLAFTREMDCKSTAFFLIDQIFSKEKAFFAHFSSFCYLCFAFSTFLFRARNVFVVKIEHSCIGLESVLPQCRVRDYSVRKMEHFRSKGTLRRRPRCERDANEMRMRCEWEWQVKFRRLIKIQPVLGAQPVLTQIIPKARPKITQRWQAIFAQNTLTLYIYKVYIHILWFFR